MAEKLTAKKQASKSQPVRRRTGAAPLSYAQQRLWFLQQLDPTSTQYNLPAAVRIEGPLDSNVLQRSFAEIVRRHESLRTTFTLIDGLPAQVVAEPREFPLPVIDVQEGAQLAAHIEAESGAPFDLEHGPLFRAQLLRQSVLEHVLLLNAHHIISDSWSYGVMVRELIALYESYSSGRAPAVAEPELQYVDFATLAAGPGAGTDDQRSPALLARPVFRFAAGFGIAGGPAARG